jgi:hypothetical protein
MESTDFVLILVVLFFMMLLNARYLFSDDPRRGNAHLNCTDDDQLS